MMRPAVFEDWQDLLDWRNDEQTRLNSVNDDIILEENHKNWLKSALNDENKLILIYECNNRPAGTVRIDYQMNVCELSWTVSPLFRGKGIGKEMVAASLEFVKMPKIRARVKQDNHSSKKIALHIGLSLAKETDDMLYFSNYGEF